MKNYKFKINGNLYEVDILEAEGNKVKIEVNGTSYDVEMEREVPKFRSTARPVAAMSKQDREAKQAAGGGAGKITGSRLLLPGCIIKCLSRQARRLPR